MSNKIYKWIPIFGQKLESGGDELIFKGGTRQDVQGGRPDQDCYGLYICNQTFTGGSISARIKFSEVTPNSCCEIVVAYDPLTRSTFQVGIAPSLSLFAARAYIKNDWEFLFQIGDRTALASNVEYDIKVTISGSIITMSVDGVNLIRSRLPISFVQSQVGLFCMGLNDISITNFEVTSNKPKAFVVMQFSAPYNDVYLDVIKNICHELDVEVLRIDESQRTGFIISDIIKGISESTFIIADITPVNANVFYEVGYAHGLNKPTILIAQAETNLPFDISPFRTLFYENSIRGKPRLESELRKYISAILDEKTGNRLTS